MDTLYRVYNISFHPSINVNKNLQYSNKAILPSSLMYQYEKLLGNKVTPLMFKLFNKNTFLDIHVSVLEFSSNDNIIYLSNLTMNNFFLQNGDSVYLTQVTLPKITKIHLQPLNSDFVKLDIDHKKNLENAIVNYYTVINLHDILLIEDCEIEVTEIQPSNSVCTYESDPTVIFLNDKETIKNNELEEGKKELEQEKKELETESNTKTETIISNLNQNIEKKKYIPFSGNGRSLNNCNTTDYQNNNKKSITKNDKNTYNKKNQHKYKAFSGKGYKLN